MNATFEGLREIIAQDYRLPLERLTPDTNLADLEIDSLGVIELIFSLEDRFDVKAPDARREFATLGEVSTYIDGLIAARDAGARSAATRQ
jgi:acyl carrier protein